MFGNAYWKGRRGEAPTLIIKGTEMYAAYRAGLDDFIESKS